MQADKDLSDAISALETGLTGQAISPAAQTHAQQLLDRLKSRIRVVVTGPAASGKSALARVLLGHSEGLSNNCHYSRIAGTEPFLPMLEVVHSGSGILDDLDLIDLQGAEGESDVIRQALCAADVVLWCTRDFSAPEAELWANAPDHLKDHSFLVLTKADELATQGQLNDRIAHLGEISQQEFHSLFPTSTLAATNELASTETLSEETFAASGVKALAQAIRKLAADGRQADLDSALLFITRHGWQPGPPSQDANAPSEQSTYDNALQLLRTHMVDVHVQQDQVSEADVSFILERCAEASDALIDLVSDAQPAPCKDYTSWSDDVLAAADKITLMSIENNIEAAVDAVGILAQLSTELEARSFH